MYDAKKANEPIDFIQLLHLTDDFYGQPFILQPWEKEVVRDVYGTLNERGYRQYSYAYLEIPKKNGKTTLIAGLGLYHLVCDGPGGQIYCCAADRDQASLAYQAMLQMIDQDETLQEILQVTDSKKLIRNCQTGTFLRVLSAEAYTKHGLNPTVVIFDELHAQPNRDLWDVMTFGAGAARKETLYWIITTAGDDPDRKSIGWEKHEYARRIRDGEIEDPYWYVKIYGAPENADIFNEQTWYECNPSLGVSIDIDKVRQEAVAAKNDPASERLFRWLRLNQWNKNKSRGWLPLTSWDATVGTWTRQDLQGCYCYGGLDLATTWDMNGFALIFPPQRDFKDYRVIFDAWIPEENMKERVRRDHVPYDEWARNGFIHPTSGNVTDYSAIRARIQEYAKMYRIRELGYDKYNATETALMLQAAGIKMVPVDQTILGMSPSMKELEVMFKTSEANIKEKKPPLITHEANPAARWCFGNVNISMDGKENYMPIKDSKTERIDIFVAMVDAMARLLPHMARRNAYAEHGVIAI
ncbi:MAG: Terminase large subunit [Oscillospiraceae bacterium]|jgi:phage terminase large subunit-like protein